MKRIIAMVCMLLIAGAAMAGDPAAKQTTGKQTQTMQAEMAKCSVCKTMLPYLDEIGPISTEVVQLGDGIAIIHTAAANKAGVFHKAGVECSAAGKAAMSLTDSQAKAQLCPLCQGVRSAVKSGAVMSQGNTKNGDIMILTSADPKVQMQLAQLGEKCAMMMDAGQASR